MLSAGDWNLEGPTSKASTSANVLTTSAIVLVRYQCTTTGSLSSCLNDMNIRPLVFEIRRPNLDLRPFLVLLVFANEKACRQLWSNFSDEVTEGLISVKV